VLKLQYTIQIPQSPPLFAHASIHSEIIDGVAGMSGYLRYIHTTDSIMKFIADLLLDFIIFPYTTDNSRKDTEKEKIGPIAISLDLAEERDNLVQDLVKMIIPVADAFDKFCVKAKEKSFPIDSVLKDREKLKEQLGIKDLLQIP
jgi:hypothetical protein